MSVKKPIRSRNQFKRWLLYVLGLPVNSNYATIRAELERRLGLEERR